MTKAPPHSSKPVECQHCRCNADCRECNSQDLKIVFFLVCVRWGDVRRCIAQVTPRYRFQHAIGSVHDRGSWNHYCGIRNQICTVPRVCGGRRGLAIALSFFFFVAGPLLTTQTLYEVADRQRNFVLLVTERELSPMRRVARLEDQGALDVEQMPIDRATIAGGCLSMRGCR